MGRTPYITNTYGKYDPPNSALSSFLGIFEKLLPNDAEKLTILDSDWPK